MRSTFSNDGWWNKVCLFFCPLCQCCPWYAEMDADEWVCFNAQRERLKLPGRLHAVPRLLTMKPTSTTHLRNTTRTGCCSINKAEATSICDTRLLITHASRRHKPGNSSRAGAQCIHACHIGRLSQEAGVESQDMAGRRHTARWQCWVSTW